MRYGIATALTALLLLGACLDEVPSEDEIGQLLENTANQELAGVRAAQPSQPGAARVPEAVRIVNVRKLGGVTDSKGVYVTSVQFDLLVVVNGVQMLSQKAVRARLKVHRVGGDWKILEKQQ